MKITCAKLSVSDNLQGIIEKKIYITGEVAYLKTKSGKELWFDKYGHLTHRKTHDSEETREYYDDGTIKCVHKINQYKTFYNEKGLRIRKIRKNGVEEFWEYDSSNCLYRWYNTIGHERKYICHTSGKVSAWYGNEPLLLWYKKTGRKPDSTFAGLI